MIIVLMDEFINMVCELMVILEFYWCKESCYLDIFFILNKING